jgi:tetratricopeptide (TPR) repeat protein
MIKICKYTLALFLCLIILSCERSKEQQEEIYLRALEIAGEGDYKTALEFIEKNIKASERKYTYYFYHGFFTQGQDYKIYSALALDDFLKAYSLNQNTYDINEMIGSIYVMLAEYEKAIPYLEQAALLYSGSGDDVPPPYWYLAEAYFRLGKFEEALAMNSRAIEKNKYPWNYLQRGIILSHGGDIKALNEYYRIAREIDPGNTGIIWDYALRLIELDYYKEAYGIYEELLEENNSYNWCYADMGYILMLCNRWDESIEKLKTSESMDNTYIQVLQYLSFYYFFTEDYERAFEYEGRARFEAAPSGTVYYRKSVEEFIEGYANIWQFQKLVKQHKDKF